MEQLNIFKGLSTEFSSKIRKAFLYNEGVNAVFVHYNDDVFEVDDKFNITKLDSLCQSGISNIAPGCGHCIALTNSGDVFAWGYNNVYQCGNGTNDNVNTPSLIKVKKVIQIASYGFHTLVLTNEGHVYAWGANESGQCGMDQCVGVEFPKMVIVEDLNTKVVSIGCGTLFSMVVLNNGNIYGWGDNNFGQLGLGMKTRFETKPRLIESLEEITIKKIACGMGHVIALSNNGTIYSWGINEYVCKYLLNI
jgi:alpha-tubulin suppressor-like RCC1 family protein